MSGHAEKLLRDELAQQEAVLADVVRDEQRYIDAGREAQARVDAQGAIVEDLKTAIASLTASPFELVYGHAPTDLEGDS